MKYFSKIKIKIKNKVITTKKPDMKILMNINLNMNKMNTEIKLSKIGLNKQ